MSEVAEAPLQEEVVSAGALLRRAREATGLHVAAVAVSLKVPVRKLEALEDDRFDDLGDPVFIRALASSVCRTLKVDPRPVLDRLPQAGAPRLVRDADGLNAPFRAPGDGAPPTWLDRLRQPVPAAVIALLLGAVIIYFLPATHHDEKLVSAPVPAAVPAPPPAVENNAASVAPVALAASAPVAETTAPAAVPNDAPPPAAAAAAPATGIVVIHTKGESWAEVVDAKGVVALRKLMAAGESVGASGALPLTVTIGKVDQTEVEVRGKKFDMRSFSKDNVARFEVK
ncbi:MAG TPA: helix-turn-helix domain-containing protein [Ramlibacter sp.]|nr:helix-turn-helix domain-containing protein [Ramlibacter sp.]